MRLSDILVRSGRVTADQVAHAAERARVAGDPEHLGELLVAEGVLTDAELLAARSELWSVPVAPPLTDEMLDPELVSRLPVEWARGHRLLPVRWQGRLRVLTANPGELAAQEDLSVLLGEELSPLLATPAEIARAIERCYFRRTDTASDFLKEMQAAPGGGAGERPAEAGPGSEDLLRMADGAPVTQLMNLILLEAVKARASDIHVEPFEDHLRVRYRVDGLLYDQSAPPKNLEAALTSRLKVMAKMDIAEKRLPQDGMARVRIGAREIDIRVSTVPVAEGERLVLRLLNRASALLSLADLGLAPEVADRFRALLGEPQGIVLVTGPTGSGKTTTLYAALQELDTKRLNIMTIEEPIEYQLPYISQMQVNPKIELTFARCLRHVLRQDPDVILVGETRDLETAEIAIRASLTGHLVFTTLHTNDAAAAPVRLMDMGAESYLLSASLRGVLAQRLARRLCPKCRVEAVVSAADVAGFPSAEAARLVGRPHWVARGCAACLEGYKGRVGLFELLTMTPELSRAVRDRAGVEQLRDLAVRGGMTPLLGDGFERVLAGETSLAELARVVGRGG